MRDDELLDQVMRELYALYDMEFFTSLMEFCQGEIRVMALLSRNNGGYSYPSELSDALYLSRQRIAALLSSLTKKGYIATEIDPDDRRRMRVSLTPAGAESLARKSAMAVEKCREVASALGAENLKNLSVILETVKAKL